MKNASNQGSNHRRSRGRNVGKRHPNQRSHNCESNGPAGKVRGTAQQVFDKYLSLARDATVSGEHIDAEAYFQFAEHYHRLLNVDSGNTQSTNTQSSNAQPGNTQPDASQNSPNHQQPATSQQPEPQQPEPQQQPIVLPPALPVSDTEKVETGHKAEVVEIKNVTETEDTTAAPVVMDSPDHTDQEPKPKPKPRTRKPRKASAKNKTDADINTDTEDAPIAEAG